MEYVDTLSNTDSVCFFGFFGGFFQIFIFIASIIIVVLFSDLQLHKSSFKIFIVCINR